MATTATKPPEDWAMFPGFLLALREAAEAAFVIGLLLGVLRQLQRTDCARIVWNGVVAGAAASGVAALAFRAFGVGAAAAAEPVFEGSTLVGAAALATWMVFWMRRNGVRLRADVETGVRRAVCSRGGGSVFGLTFLAVAREGIELAFFLTAAATGTNGTYLLAGAALGIVTAVLLAWLVFTGTVRLNQRRFFQGTGIGLVLFAAGLLARGIQEFNEAGWIPGIIDPVWNSDGLLRDDSLLGEAARILLGYSSAPSLTAIVGYGVYVAVVAVFLARRPAVRTPELATD